MFDPKRPDIEYRIVTAGGLAAEFTIRLDESGRLREPRCDDALWAERVPGGCPDCRAASAKCLAASAIAPVVERFRDVGSLEQVHAVVRQDDRHCEIRCTAPRALASIMGLLIAASGCHKSMPFRAMALYHQPFATADETLTRAAGFWLLNRWAGDSLCADSPFDDLIEAWADLEEINQQLSRRLHSICPTDAAPNGLAFLDALAKIGMMGLESRLEALRPALGAAAKN